MYKESKLKDKKLPIQSAVGIHVHVNLVKDKSYWINNGGPIKQMKKEYLFKLYCFIAYGLQV